MNHIHATSVLISLGQDKSQSHAILLRGPSGIGKSDLAFRLIDQDHKLISDDQTVLKKEGERLIALPAPNIKGLLEVRGVGIVPVDTADKGEVHLIVDLQSPIQERIPDPETDTLLGIDIARAVIDPHDKMAVKKIIIALKLALNH